MGLPLMRRGTQCGSADSATQSIVQTRRITSLCYRFITETAADIYCCEAAGICIAPPGRRSVSRAALCREIFVILAIFSLVQVGRAHVRHSVNNAHHECHFLMSKNNK